MCIEHGGASLREGSRAHRPQRRFDTEGTLVTLSFCRPERVISHGNVSSKCPRCRPQPDLRGVVLGVSARPVLPLADSHPFHRQGPSRPVTRFSTSSKVKACARRSSARAPAPQRLSPWPSGGMAGPPAGPAGAVRLRAVARVCVAGGQDPACWGPASFPCMRWNGSFRVVHVHWSEALCPSGQ